MIDYNQSSQYTISIRISADGFCFAIHHPERVGEYAFMPYEVDPMLPLPANLKRAKESLQMLGYTYGQTDVLIADAPYTLVPNEYDIPETRSDYYLQNFPLMPSHDEVLCGELSGGQQKLLFGVDKALLQWVERLFPGAVVHHSLQPVLTYFINRYAHTFLVNLHEKKADVLFVDNKRLQFVNTFDYNAPDDVSYFVMGVWNTLGLSQAEDSLLLCGKASDVRALRPALERFICRVDICHPSELFHGTELARLGNVPMDICALVSHT